LKVHEGECDKSDNRKILQYLQKENVARKQELEQAVKDIKNLKQENADMKKAVGRLTKELEEFKLEEFKKKNGNQKEAEQN